MPMRNQTSCHFVCAKFAEEERLNMKTGTKAAMVLLVLVVPILMVARPCEAG